MTNIKFVLLHPLAVKPSYAHPGDAGADLCSIEPISLAPGQRALIRTGLALQIPDGYVGLVQPRSGLAIKQGLSVINTPGTIDSGYRGEVMVGLINHDPESTINLAAGARIAQLLIQKVELATFEQVAQLDDSDRSTGGFGSTGVTP